MTLFLSLLITCSSAITNVPEVVKAAFSDRYGEAALEEVVWGIEEDRYMASFTDGQDQLLKVYFSAEGKWQQSQARIYPSQLPSPVYSYYEANCFEKDVTFLAKVTFPDQTTEYRIEWESYEAVQVERLSAKGELIALRQIFFTKLW